MEYLLVMALSGSTMTCLYLLARRLLRKRLSADTYYLLAKAAVLYYLIPLPFLKTWYHDIIPTTVLDRRMEPARIPLTWTNHTVHVNGDLRVNVYAVIQTAIVIVWLSGACVLLMKQLISYLRITRRFAEYAEVQMTDRERMFVDSLRREYGVRRRVSLISARNGESTITFGIRRPVIICGKETASREAALLARHEMVHIRRLDVVWKILVEFTKLLHWWNPFMRKLYREFEVVCECSCDEAAMRGKADGEVKEYLRLLIEEAREKKPEENTVRWKFGFGSSATYIRERMDNLMKKNKWSRFAAGALTMTLIFANSMTVFAYRDTVSEILPEDVSQEEIATVFDKDVLAFTFSNTSGDEAPDYEMAEAIEILYDSQFTDEEGNIYPVSEDGGAVTYCNHYYKPGQVEEHYPQSGGGCTVKIYNGERCLRCGQIIRGDWINTVTYAVCPH